LLRLLLNKQYTLNTRTATISAITSNDVLTYAAPSAHSRTAGITVRTPSTRGKLTTVTTPVTLQRAAAPRASRTSTCPRTLHARRRQGQATRTAKQAQASLDTNFLAFASAKPKRCQFVISDYRQSLRRRSLSFLISLSLPLFFSSTVPSERKRNGQESERMHLQ